MKQVESRFGFLCMEKKKVYFLSITYEKKSGKQFPFDSEKLQEKYFIFSYNSIKIFLHLL
jgi:hypothetical protein